MRNASLVICFFVLVLFAGCDSQNHNLVNSIIGNISFVEKFNVEPDENTDNGLRIKTHLQYVERLLRSKDVSHLSTEFKDKRLYLLDLLHSYADAGLFPKNYDYKGERKPCFIDKDQNICAVGYLIEKTAGRAVAETINAEYKYDNISDMNSRLVNEWVATSGLTKEECAMIQPTYNPLPGGDPTPDYRVKPGYAISSAVLMGANATFNAINIIDLAKGKGKKTAPVLGLLTGTTQIVMGAVGFGRERDLTKYYNDMTFTSQGKISLFNIGIGTTTVLLSTWNLLKQKKMTQKRTSWNIYSFPTGNNQTGVGLSFCRKI